MFPFSSPPALRNNFKRTLLLAAFAMLLGTADASAQVSIKVQNFSGDLATLSTYVTNTTNANASNSGSAGFFLPNFTQPGFGAFGVQDDNASDVGNVIPVVFETQVFQENSTSNVLSFQLGQRDTGGNGGGGRGFSNANRVEVSISLNGLASTVLIIVGPVVTGNDSGPSFDIGTGGARTTSSAIPTIVTMTPTGGIGNFTITLPDFKVRTDVGVTIAIRAARKSTVLIDNVTISSSRPLPVELTRFNAAAQAKGIALSWATATEKNNDRFEVQRSADGQSFQTIGTVKGQGNSSSLREYSFTDSRPFAGQSYYRLRQVDTDGSSAFSPVVTVQTRTEVAVYPNPATNAVVLPSTLGPVRYRVLNAVGQTLLSGNATGNDRLDLTTLNKGVFFLEMTGAAGRTTQRLVRE